MSPYRISELAATPVVVGTIRGIRASVLSHRRKLAKTPSEELPYRRQSARRSHDDDNVVDRLTRVIC